MIAVTGANGFIGKNLCAEIKKRGLGAVAIVRTNQAARGLMEEGIECRVAGSIEEIDSEKRLFDGFSTVVHCAGDARDYPKLSDAQKTAIWKINVDGTLNMANIARNQGVKRFVFLSSVKVHGDAKLLRNTLSEESAIEPRGIYGKAKHAAEELLADLAIKDNFEIIIVRIPQLYGCGCGGLLGRVQRLVELQVPFPICHNEGLRSMIGVNNLAAFLIRCCDLNVKMEAACTCFFISDCTDMRIEDFVARLCEARCCRDFSFPMNRRMAQFGLAVIGRTELFERVFGNLKIDTSKARRVLGWYPEYSFEQQTSDIKFRKKK